MTLPVGAWIELKTYVEKLYQEYHSPSIKHILDWLEYEDPHNNFKREVSDDREEDQASEED